MDKMDLHIVTDRRETTEFADEMTEGLGAHDCVGVRNTALVDLTLHFHVHKSGTGFDGTCFSIEGLFNKAGTLRTIGK